MLSDWGVEPAISKAQVKYRLLPYQSFLTQFGIQLIRKVQSGQDIKEAVEDIINRGVGELRKNAFGDDAEDAKSLPWSREQAWLVLKQLSKLNEVSLVCTIPDILC